MTRQERGVPVKDKVIVLGSNGLGQGDAQLGGLLEANLLRL